MDVKTLMPLECYGKDRGYEIEGRGEQARMVKGEEKGDAGTVS